MSSQIDQPPTERQHEDASDAQLELRIRGLRKRYGQTIALDGIDLNARAGEVLGVAGPNGAGKSTLVRAIAGEAVEDSGEFTLAGVPWELSQRQHNVAVVHQEPQLFPTLTVVENLAVGVEPTRFARPRTSPEQRATLESLGIGGLLDTPVETCSLVSQQLVEIARAVLRDASVFLFDEPNSALTVEESARLFSRIRELREQRRCVVLLVTHRLTDLVESCDRVIVIRDGRVSATLAGAQLTTASLSQAIAGTWMSDRGSGTAAEAPDDAASASRMPAAARSLSESTGDARLVLEARGWTDAKGSAFSGIDLEVRASEALVITGQEASGGRELVRSLAGLRRARGSLTIDGVSSRARLERVCYVPANRAVALFQNFSVAANLAARLGRGEIASRLGLLRVARMVSHGRSLIARLRVRTESPRYSISSLSGGNQQKVSVGGALAAGPRVLLVEEPTRGVDVTTKQEIYSSLREYLNEGNSLIAFSPEVEDLFHLGDTARVMVAGRLSDPVRVADFASLEELTRWVDATATGKLSLDANP